MIAVEGLSLPSLANTREVIRNMLEFARSKEAINQPGARSEKVRKNKMSRNKACSNGERLYA